jgi:hypothetical protein
MSHDEKSMSREVYINSCIAAIKTAQDSKPDSTYDMVFSAIKRRASNAIVGNNDISIDDAVKLLRIIGF